jgi:DNA-directed RNA polymerase subunit E'/Rpb7
MTGLRALINLLVYLSLAFPALAQHRYEASVEKPPKSGFYKIRLTPDMRARLSINLADLRIVDKNGKPVAYLLPEGGSGAMPEGAQHQLLIAANTLDSSGNSIIVLKNEQQASLDHFMLVMSNTDVVRRVNLSGSPDGQNWFIIKERISLETILNETDNNLEFLISFPASIYPFFKLEILNGKGNPLHVTGAFYESGYEQARKVGQENKIQRINQKIDSDGNNDVYIDQQEKYPVEGIRVRITSPRFYKRSASLYLIDGTDKQRSAVTEFMLSSEDSAWIDLPVSKGLHYRLVVRNGDNPALDIQEIVLMHYRQYIYAYLEAGERYKLWLDDREATKPVYDLEQFRKEVPAQIAELTTSDIMAVIKPKESSEKATTNRIWMWIAIVLGIGAMSALTMRLLRDMKKAA